MSYTIPRPEHPNPQRKRESFINLNGEWMFEIDTTANDVDRGLAKAAAVLLTRCLTTQKYSPSATRSLQTLSKR